MIKDYYIGKARIELHNVHTGRTEKIEHGNVFKGENIQRYLQTFGCFNNQYISTLINGKFDIWKDVLGGIFIFDSAVNTNAKNVPAGVKMTANGAHEILNSADPVEMGSWNATESSVSSDGNTITLVWDWTTSQGNGDIACVCLTSYTAGFIGIGNQSMTRHTNGLMFNGRRTPQYNSNAGYLYSKNRQIYLNTISSDDIATFIVRNVWARNAVLDGASYNQTVQLTAKPITVTVFGVVQLTETKIAILQTNNYVVSAGGTLYIDVVDLESWTVTSKDVTNTTGGYIGAANASAFRGGTFGALSDHEIIMWNGTDISAPYILDINTGTFSSLPLGDYPGGTNGSAGFIRINDGLMVLPGTFVSGVAQQGYMYDHVNGTVLPINSGNGYVVPGTAINDDTIGGLISMSYGAIYSNPFYLATINNLEEPVTKDVSKTMKVIYTLQKAS